MIYRPEIDGIRAIAVIAVLLFHLDLRHFSGGFVGVDVFFVISGYLITSILQRDLEKKSFSIITFYDRRIRRILPALYIVLILSSIVAFLLFMPYEMEAYCKSLISSLAFYSNFYFWSGSGYFDLDSKLKPLLHTWSLSIEEQFYIVYPTLLYAIHKYGKAYRVRLIFLFFAISFAGSIWLASDHPEPAFYFSPVRAWELLFGALLAFKAFPTTQKRILNEAFSWLGLFLISYSIYRFNADTEFPGLNATIPCLGTAFLIHFSGSSKNLTWPSQFLGTKIMCSIGKISYSLYLWHRPVIVFWKYRSMNPLTGTDQIVITAIVLILSILSWRWVEQPFRSQKNLFKTFRSVLIPMGVITFIIVLFAAYGGFVTQGYPTRFSARAQQFAKGAKDINPDRAHCHDIPIEKVERGELCVLGNAAKSPDFIVWGDSFASALMPVIKDLAKEHGVSGLFASSSACGPFLGLERKLKKTELGCNPFNQAMVDVIERKAIKNVLMISGWGVGGYRRIVPSKDSFFNSENLNRYQKEDQMISYGLKQTLHRLQSLGARAWIVTKIPKPGFNVPTRLAQQEILGKNINEVKISRQLFLKSQRRTSNILNNLNNEYAFQIIDPNSILCPKDCLVEANGRALYYDQQHLTTFGAFYTKPAFKNFFNSMKH